MKSEVVVGVVKSCRFLRCEKILKTVMMNKMENKNKNKKYKIGLLMKRKKKVVVTENGSLHTNAIIHIISIDTLDTTQYQYI